MASKQENRGLGQLRQAAPQLLVQPPMRRSLPVVGLVLPGMLVARVAVAQTGNMNLHLAPPAGTVLTQSNVVVSNSSIGFSTTAMHCCGAGPFAHNGLLAANGYAVNVTSATSLGGGCSGSTFGFPIVTNGTTIVVVNLVCGQFAPARVPALGRYGPLLAVALICSWLAIGTLTRQSLPPK